MTLLAQASQRKAQAQRLLEQTGLLTLLEGHGKVVFTGSYEYDLMVAPDIDLYLVSPDASREHAQRLLNELIDQSEWNAYMFYDWVKYSHEGFPSAYYLGVRIEFEKERWKVDLWLVNKLPADRKDFDQKMGALSDYVREAILKAKREAPVTGKSSKAIYEQFLK